MAYRRQLRPFTAFTAIVLGVHVLGWAAYALGRATGGAATAPLPLLLAHLLQGLGLLTYLASVLWLVRGLGRGSLQAVDQQRPCLRSLLRLPRGEARRLLSIGLLIAAILLGIDLLVVLAWTLAGPLGRPVGIAILVAGILTSLVFLASQSWCVLLGLESTSPPWRIVLETGRLSLRAWSVLLPVLASLGALALLLLVALAGLVQLRAGLGPLLMALFLIVMLPLGSCCLASAYRAVQPPLSA